MFIETGPLVQPLFAGRGVGEATAEETGGVVSAMYVNVSALVAGLVPLGVVTRTSTVPRAWAGAWTVRRSGDCTLTLVPATAPKLTLVPPVRKSEPFTVTTGAH